jgi:hypothetical protein
MVPFAFAAMYSWSAVWATLRGMGVLSTGSSCHDARWANFVLWPTFCRVILLARLGHDHDLGAARCASMLLPGDGAVTYRPSYLCLAATIARHRSGRNNNQNKGRTGRERDPTCGAIEPRLLDGGWLYGANAGRYHLHPRADAPWCRWS